MAHVGKTIDHPLSGERLTFLETSATTGGSYLKMRLEMRPGGALPRPHTHPGQRNGSTLPKAGCRLSRVARPG